MTTRQWHFWVPFLLCVSLSLTLVARAADPSEVFTPMFWLETQEAFGPSDIDPLYDIVLYRWSTIDGEPTMVDSILALQAAGYEVITYLSMCSVRDRDVGRTNPVIGALGDTVTGGWVNCTEDGWLCRRAGVEFASYFFDPRQSAIRDALVDSFVAIVDRADYTPDGFMCDHLMDDFYEPYCDMGSPFEADSSVSFDAGYKTTMRLFTEALAANLDGTCYINGNHADGNLNRVFEKFPESVKDNDEVYGGVDRNGFVLDPDYRGLDVELFHENGVLGQDYGRVMLLPMNGWWMDEDDMTDYEIVTTAAFANAYVPGRGTVIQCGEASKDHTSFTQDIIDAIEITTLWPRAGYFVSGEIVPATLPDLYDVVVVPWFSLGENATDTKNAKDLQADGLEVYVSIPIAYLDPDGTSTYHTSLLAVIGDTTDGEWLFKHTGSTVSVRYSSQIDSTNLKWIDPRDETARNALITAHAAIINGADWEPDGFFFDRIFDEIDWMVDQDLDGPGTIAFDAAYETAIHALATGIKNALDDQTALVYGNGEHTCTDMDGMVLWNFPTTREWYAYVSGATKTLITRTDTELFGDYGKDNWETVTAPPMIVPFTNYALSTVPDVADSIPMEVVVEAVAFGHTFAPNSIIFDNEAAVGDIIEKLYGHNSRLSRAVGNRRTPSRRRR